MKMKWMNFSRRLPISMGLATAMMIASPSVMAQSNQSDSQQQRQRSSQQDRQSDERSSQQNRRSSQQGQSSGQNEQDRQRQQRESDRQSSQNDRQRQSGQAQYRLSPQGWVRVAADYNNDGRYDAFETIYIYDLQQARERSQQRREGQASRQQGERGDSSQRGQRSMMQRDQRQMAQRDGRSQRNQMDRRRQSRSVQGEITSLKSVTMAGMQEPHQLAKIETDEGRTATVCLGTKSELERLDLQEGDQVQVRGQLARLNDRQILLADNIRHDGRSVTVDQPSRSDMKRVKAEIQSTREVRFRGLDQPFVIGQVETQSGKQEMVNFGPASKFDQLNVGSGDQVRLLVRQGRINGRDALIAQEVEADGDRIRITTADDRERFNQRNRSQSRR